jgi:hypothetical protein
MLRSLRPPLVLALLIAATSCAIDDVVPPGGSCTMTASMSCVDYTGDAWRTPTTAQSACRNAMGVYATTACPTANRVGTCRVSGGGNGVEIDVRFYRPLPVTAAQMGCASQGGAFTAN